MKNSILAKISKKSSIYVTCSVLVAVLTAPLFSFPTYTNTNLNKIENATKTEIVSKADLGEFQEIAESEEYFNPDGFEISEYTREEFDVINRSALAQSEDLLFGTMDEEFADEQIPVPPDLTFEEDNTTMYVIANSLSFREMPDVKAKTIETYYWGDTLLRTGIGEEWFRVKDTSGNTGYVMSGYFSSTKPTPSPTPSPSPTLTPAPTKAPVKANSIGESIALEAQKYLGVRYVWAGKSPKSGFDCTGFTYYVFNRYGISTPPGTSSYAGNVGTKIPYSMIAPGDVITWNNGRGNSIDHVSLYIGNGKMIHATLNGGVRIHGVAYYQGLGYRLMTVHRFYK